MADYKTWKDRGDNIGVQCLSCFRTHWTGEEPNTDPLTGQPCMNCEDIKTEDILKKERDVHKHELAKYESDRQALVAASEDPNNAVLHCSHLASQL